MVSDTRKTKSDLTDELNALRKRNEELEAIYKGLVDGVMVVDMGASTIVRANPPLASMLGYSQEELIGMPITKVHPPEELQRVGREMEKGREGLNRVQDLVCLRKDGSSFLADMTSMTVNLKGNPCGVAFFKDVTESRKAQAEIAMTVAALNTISDVFFVFDLDGKFMKWNERFNDVTGYSDDEIAGMTPVDLFTGDDVKRVADAIGKVVELGESRVEALFTTKEGLSIPFEFTGTLLKDSDGKPYAIVGTGRDNSERKKFEEELRLKDSAISTSINGIAIADMEGRLTYANKSYLDLYGYESPGEVLGREVVEFMKDEQELATAMSKTLEEGGWVGELKARKKDGSLFDGQFTTSLIVDDKGNPDAMLATMLDITERKRSEEKYRTLFEFSQDALMTLAPPSWRFTSCNPAALEMFGAKGEREFTSDAPWDLSPDLQPDGQSSADKARDMIDKALRDGSFLFEWTHRRLDGEEFPATVTLTRMEIGGETVVQATVRDITEWKAAGKALLRANEELEGYAHTVSHDLKGPLTVIALAANTFEGLLKEPITDETRGELMEIAEMLVLSVVKSSDLIEDLLALAEAGQVPRDITDVDVAEVVSRTLEEKAGDLKEKNIKVKVSKDLGHVRANRTHIYQLFTNILGNAIKHCRSEAPVIEVSYLGDDDGAHRYLVRDNGEGIPPEDLDRIFEPFFKGKSGGAGIGLATVAKIVNVYDGSIRAYNDGGACFKFTLRDFDEVGL